MRAANKTQISGVNEDSYSNTDYILAASSHVTQAIDDMRAKALREMGSTQYKNNTSQGQLPLHVVR
jgi:hypothetical protein